MSSANGKLIEKRIATGLLFEAKTLLAIHEESLEAQEFSRLNDLIEGQIEKVATIMRRAEAQEAAGELTGARQLCDEAAEIAADHPGLQTMIQRLDTALQLAWAVRHRRQRRQQDQPGNQSRPLGLTWQGLPHPLATLILVLLTGAGIIGYLMAGSKGPERHAFTPPPPPSPSAPAEPAARRPPPLSAPRTQPVQEAVTRQAPLPPATAQEVASAAIMTEDEEQPTEGPPPIALVDGNSPGLPDPREETDTAPDQTPLPPVPMPAAPSPAAQPSTTTAAAELPQWYEIRSGDSLSLIAHRLFCDESAMELLFMINHDLIAAPDVLEVGQKIRLWSATTKIPSRCEPAPLANDVIEQAAGSD